MASTCVCSLCILPHQATVNRAFFQVVEGVYLVTRRKSMVQKKTTKNVKENSLNPFYSDYC